MRLDRRARHGLLEDARNLWRIGACCKTGRVGSSSGRDTRRAGVAAIASLVIALLAGAALGLGKASAAAAPATVVVSVDATRPARALPADFIGLSYEVKELPTIASLAGRGNYVALLRAIGPGTLRFGGVTADSQVAWLDPASQPLPSWATTALTPADLRALAQLARASGWRVVLTVNLDHFDPMSAADEAAVAHRALGVDLRGIEIGNEPTAYVAERLRPRPYNFAMYRREVDAYIAAIHAGVPGLAIYGPDNEPKAGNPKNLRWARDEAREIRPRALTAHLYGASKCSRVPPTIPFLLGPTVRAADGVAIDELEGLASRYRIPVWLDETNSVSCGGEPGVSNTFAGALWAVDLLTRVLKAPFVGAAFHGFLTKPEGYAPIAAASPSDMASGHLTAEPEWYALLLAHEVARDRPVPVTLSPAVPGLAVWAGLTPAGRLQMIAVNDAQSHRVSLSLPVQYGQTMTLAAPTASATSGVSLGGNSVLSDGSWYANFSAVGGEGAGNIVTSVQPASALLVDAGR